VVLHASTAPRATSKIVKAKRAARNALSVNSAMSQELTLASLALQVNTSLSQAPSRAEYVLAEPSPLPVKVLAPSAPRVNSLPPELLLALVALLDITQTSLGLGCVQHVQSAPNALALPSPPPLFALPALSSPSLPRAPVLLALRSRMRLELALQSA
jgi:hypothetical protein